MRSDKQHHHELDGVITYSNPAHHRMLGYDPGELIGKTIFDLIDGPDERNNLKEYLAYLVSEQPTPTPYLSYSRCKDGSPLATQVDWNYKYDKNGNLTMTIQIQDLKVF